MRPEQRNEEQSTNEVISGNQASLRAMEFSYQGRITEAGEIFNEVMKNPGKMLNI